MNPPVSWVHIPLIAGYVAYGQTCSAAISAFNIHSGPDEKVASLVMYDIYCFAKRKNNICYKQRSEETCSYIC
jgi:hypothetical protein